MAILNYFDEWSQALTYVADQCRANPTNTIWGILSAHYREAKFIEEAERLRGEQERHRQLTEQLLESEVRVAELNSRLSVAEARIAELERLIHERETE